MSGATSWPGCHGVRLATPLAGFGTVGGDPIADAALRVGAVRPAGPAPIWTQRGEAVVDGRRVDVDRSMYRLSDGTYLLTGNRGPAIAVDRARAVVTIADGEHPAHLQLQLLAAFAVPLILHGTPTLVVHGSACTRGDQTVVVCGDSGSGKSSTLVALVDAGWEALTEDVCAIDFRADRPVVWPGPPWVRVARGQPGPRGSAVSFEAGDKTGWDLAMRQATRAQPLTHVVLLDEPGGEVAARESLPRADAIAALARHAVWLADPDDRAARLFGLTAHLAGRVPVFRVRLPRRESWVDEIPQVLDLG